MTYFFCILQRSEFQQALKKKTIGALKKKILVHFIKSYFQIYQNRILSETCHIHLKKSSFTYPKKNKKIFHLKNK